jgi:Calcineurin-like phosphoesterase
MRTAIVSDLHLGSSRGEDLLGNAEIRRLLLEEIDGADRLVLLGDAIETRDRPLPAVLDSARPFFQALGEALAGREVLLVPGNHDHRIAEPLLEGLAGEGAPLGLEHRAEPVAPPAREVAEWLGGAELRIAYPGAWLREDVYATHGHYMDCHMTLPRAECVAAALLMRVLGSVPEAAAPGDYEGVLRPLYGFSFGLAQSGLTRRSSNSSERAWRALSGSSRGRRGPRWAALRVAVAGGFPTGVWTVNRLLRADFSADLSPAAITRSGVAAASELARRLGLDAAHVIAGHTHRAGPRPDDGGWPLAGGGSLHNTGCWTFTSAFHRPGTPPGPYWPGSVTWVEDDDPPRRVSLLEGLSREALRGIVRRQSTARRAGA